MMNLELQLDDLWRKAIKLRDVFCRHPECNQFSTDACHIKKRRHRATRWDLKNGIGMCHKHHDEETESMLIMIVGRERFDDLTFKANQSVKYYRTDLLEIKSVLQSYYNKLVDDEVVS